MPVTTSKSSVPREASVGSLPPLSDVAGELGDATDDRENRRSDRADPWFAVGPSELNLVRAVFGRLLIHELKRRLLTSVAQVRQEMNLRLLRDPLRAAHRLDQLDSPGHERAGVGDAFTQFIAFPAEVCHQATRAASRASSLLSASAQPPSLGET